MQDIRKIAVGADYKNGAMHYMTGQSVLKDTATIHLINFDETNGSYKVWIENMDREVLLWKEFNWNMPISVEFNIDF